MSSVVVLTLFQVGFVICPQASPEYVVCAVHPVKLFIFSFF